MTTHAHCPRCDYDLSGETSRWELQCPLFGRCPECGLDFAWTHICHPERWVLDGFVEHAKGSWRTFRWAWRTWWWALVPWRFWERVQMHHAFRFWKLVQWAAFVILLPHVIGAVCNTGAEIGLSGGWTPTGWSWLDRLVYPVAQLDGWWWDPPKVYWTIHDWPTMGIWLIVGVTTLPILLGLMPISLRRAKVRYAHVVRAWVYSASVPGVFYSLNALNELASTALSPMFYSRSATWDAYVAICPVVFRLFYITSGLWLACWWFFALTRGWKLRHGWAVWLCMIAVAVILGVGYGGFEFRLFGNVYRF